MPISCKEFGEPFISKTVSAFIERLQRNGFQWEDKPFIELLEKYCTEISESEAIDKNGRIKKGIGEHQNRYFKGCCAVLRCGGGVMSLERKASLTYAGINI